MISGSAQEKDAGTKRTTYAQPGVREYFRFAPLKCESPAGRSGIGHRTGGMGRRNQPAADSSPAGFHCSALSNVMRSTRTARRAGTYPAATQTATIVVATPTHAT